MERAEEEKEKGHGKGSKEEDSKADGNNSSKEEDSKVDGSNNSREARQRAKGRRTKVAISAALRTIGREIARRGKGAREMVEERPREKGRPGGLPTARLFATSAEASVTRKDSAQAEGG